MARKKFQFWLNDKRQEDWIVFELIPKLKKPEQGMGQFTRAIREGIRIWHGLQNGDLEVLFEYFPQYRAQFQPDTAEALAQFMQILQRQQSAPQMQPVGQGPKQIAAPSFDMPNFEEDDDDQPTIVLTKGDDMEASRNFMKSMGGVL